MEHHLKPFRSIARRLSAAAVAMLLACSLAPTAAAQQEGGYQLQAAPDLWYNDVDGIRVGLRMRGGMAGTFGDGPHRLDTGLWLATWWPDHPVSYFFSFTEPIPGLSDFRSEGSLALRSSIRTGFHRHGLSLNKRWQSGFDERSYREASLYGRAENRFDGEYTAWPGVWREGWLWLAGGSFRARGHHRGGEWIARLNALANVAGDREGFIRYELALQHRLDLGTSFRLYSRLFTGISSPETPPQYLFMRSLRTPAAWMESGYSRAKGTIPQPWLRDGFMHLSGGANLRGYLRQDVEALNRAGSPPYPPYPLYRGMGSLNVELQLPNPLDRAIGKIPVVGELLELRSYLFFDTGTPLATSGGEAENLLADAGPGFMLALNIPDYLGKPRGFMLRYDLPLWLSHPQGENSFKFRNIVGIGAVISL